MNSLVTGATGFIGTHLIDALRLSHHAIAVLARWPETVSRRWPATAIDIRHGDLDKAVTLKGVCAGVDTVFHLAGCAHDKNNYDTALEDRYWHTIVEGTRALLREAVEAGVKRFVFVSSVKAMGEGGPGRLDETSPLMPESAYGRAKLAAERAVLDAGHDHDMRTAILRLPLVYGPGNKGNIPRMIKAIDRGLFPPLPRNGSRRSMVHVADVVQALLLAAEAEAPTQQVYIVTDGVVYSTREIYDMIRAAMGLPPRRWSVPTIALRVLGACGDLIGKVRGAPFVLDSQVLSKLLGSAWYSSDKITRELGFRPTHTLRDALPAMVAEYQGVKLQAEGGLAG